MTTTRTTRRRLERAGYAYVQAGTHAAGWVPRAFAARVEAQIAAHRETVEAIAAEPVAPRGRPKKP
jgi:hypothetical protein